MTEGLHLGDCLELMRSVPDAAVDLVFCDLPYGTTRNPWDVVLPFDELWAAYRRILRPGGVVLLTAAGLFAAEAMLSNREWFRYKWVWEKSKATNFLNAKRQPLRKHEDVLVFYASKPTYNPQMGEGIAYDKGVRKDQPTGSYGGFRPTRVKSGGWRYPTDVFYHKTAESEGRTHHSTQKPVGLVSHFIRTYSNRGDLVLDNCVGCGTTAVAAIREGRRFLAFEKDPAFHAIAASRIAEETAVA